VERHHRKQGHRPQRSEAPEAEAHPSASQRGAGVDDAEARGRRRTARGANR
jgi:hypothetical protein